MPMIVDSPGKKICNGVVMSRNMREETTAASLPRVETMVKSARKIVCFSGTRCRFYFTYLTLLPSSRLALRIIFGSRPIRSVMWIPHRLWHRIASLEPVLTAINRLRWYYFPAGYGTCLVRESRLWGRDPQDAQSPDQDGRETVQRGLCRDVGLAECAYIMHVWAALIGAPWLICLARIRFRLIKLSKS